VFFIFLSFLANFVRVIIDFLTKEVVCTYLFLFFYILELRGASVGDNSQGVIKHRLPRKYYTMIGASDLHHYIAYKLPDGRVEVRFFRLPLVLDLPYDGYAAELVSIIEEYLMKQHDIMSVDQKSVFRQSLYVEDGKIGAFDVSSSTRCEFGYVALRVRTSILANGLSVTDFSDSDAALATHS